MKLEKDEILVAFDFNLCKFSVAPPPKPPRDTPRRSLSSKDPFETADDFNPRAGEVDPFGMGEFTGAQFDQRILEMKVNITLVEN